MKFWISDYSTTTQCINNRAKLSIKRCFLFFRIYPETDFYMNMHLLIIDQREFYRGAFILT